MALLSGPTVSLYIHWPYCRSICPYCHFNRTLHRPIDEEAWRRSFAKEMRYWAQKTPQHTLVSIFFGGGTPSLMPPALTKFLLDMAKSLWVCCDSVEITLEMNPSDVDHLDAFQNAGINRLSLGVQSFDAEVLSFLGRSHRPQDLHQALTSVVSSSIAYSFDLIYGHLFHKDVDRWQRDLDQACPWIDRHVSLYQLSYEEGTPFYKKRHQVLPDELVLALEEKTARVLEPLGLARYEVSNYATPNHESRHNLQYWYYGDFLALGPGSHGRLRRKDVQGGALLPWAIKNYNAPEAWMDAVTRQGHGAEIYHPLTLEISLQEHLLMCLRLSQGISLRVLEAQYHQVLSKDFWARVAQCCQAGLMYTYERVEEVEILNAQRQQREEGICQTGLAGENTPGDHARAGEPLGCSEARGLDEPCSLRGDRYQENGALGAGAQGDLHGKSFPGAPHERSSHKNVLQDQGFEKNLGSSPYGPILGKNSWDGSEERRSKDPRRSFGEVFGRGSGGKNTFLALSPAGRNVLNSVVAFLQP